MAAPWWVTLALLGAGGERELILLPAQPEASVSPHAAEKAWRALMEELDRAQRVHPIRLNAQAEARGAVTGPAKDQAWECKLEPACLAALGGTLGAELVVTGTLEKDGVTLVLVDVAAAKRIVTARSSPKLSGAGVERQAAAALKGLFKGYVAWLKEGSPAAKPKEPAKRAAIVLSKETLDKVLEVTIDGAPVAPEPDGRIQWFGGLGPHRVTAVRADGARAEHEVSLEAETPIELALSFSAPPPALPIAPPVAAAPPLPPAPTEVISAGTPWWLWTSLGGAVAVGVTTAVVLFAGAKGGPSIREPTGSVTGRY